MRRLGLVIVFILLIFNVALADEFSAIITKVSMDSGKTTVYVVNSTKDKYKKGGKEKPKEPEKAKEPEKDKTKDADKAKDVAKDKDKLKDDKTKDPDKDKDKVKFGPETGLEVADNLRITKVQFNKDTKRVEHGKAITNGLRNEMFEKIERGIPARFITSPDKKVTDIIILTPPKKKGIE